MLYISLQYNVSHFRMTQKLRTRGERANTLGIGAYNVQNEQFYTETEMNKHSTYWFGIP